MILSRCYNLVSNHWGKNIYCIYFLFFRNHESRPINESSYSTGPCNNLATPLQIEAKNNLVSLNLNKTTTKTTAELNEKNNLNNLATSQSIENDLVVDLTPAKIAIDTSLTYGGTIPRNNGTLCKKVYL